MNNGQAIMDYGSGFMGHETWIIKSFTWTMDQGFLQHNHPKATRIIAKEILRKYILINTY